MVEERLSPPTIISPVSESSTDSCARGRDSSMPDIEHYTARLRRLSDKTPSLAPPKGLPFTGASSANAIRRLQRLTPPPSPIPSTHCPVDSPGYFGADVTTYDRRSRRYLDRSHSVPTARGGPPVFSGANIKAHTARMLRLVDHV